MKEYPENLKENFLRAKKIEDERNAKIKIKREIESMRDVCIENGICPDCGGKLRAIGNTFSYGLFKREIFYRSDVRVECTECLFLERSYPIEGINYDVDYK